MFFDGFPGKGACPSGGGHAAAGFMFALPYDVSVSPTAQNSWRFCNKCNAMFFDGFPGKGTCPTGGGYAATGFNEANADLINVVNSIAGISGTVLGVVALAV